MENIVVNKHNENSNGAKILKDNKFFNEFISLMNNVEFKSFYDNYFHDWTDIQTMIFYMKLHHTIDYEYNERYNSKISDELMTESLHNIITNTQTRKYAMQLFHDFKLDHDASKTFRTLIPFNDKPSGMYIEN
jgi:hypothetical protein